MSEIIPVFVDALPDELEDGRLYISLQYRTIAHKCACGCGAEINTPLHPTGWALTYDGVRVSVWPSVGNWSEKCRSHYWIDKNQILWSRPWTREQIRAGRKQRADDIRKYHETLADMAGVGEREATGPPKKNLTRLKKWLYHKLRTLWEWVFG